MTSEPHKVIKMAYPHSKSNVDSLQDESSPTEIVIKNIPFGWKTGRLRRLMRQTSLPVPIALSYIRDDYHQSPGQAFVTFASSDESWRVIQRLNCLRVSGRSLNVQFMTNHSDDVSKDNKQREGQVHHNHASPVYGATTANSQHQPKQSSTRTPRTSLDASTCTKRDPTPPSESYDLLMGYQTSPTEKEKLRSFLAQTGNYEKAVNEFAKNRARETQEGLHGTCIMQSTRLEMRPPTPGEEEQIAKIENLYGRGGRARYSECIGALDGGELGATGGLRGRSLDSVNNCSPEKGIGRQEVKAEPGDR